MKVSAQVALLLFTNFLFSCTGTTSESREPSLEAIVNDFAPLECRAVALREQRFALANQIRFTEDTLRSIADKKDTLRLHAILADLNDRRTTTTQQSLQLADSIKHTLDSLMNNYLTTAEEKEKFNEMLHATLKSMHCSDSL